MSKLLAIDREPEMRRSLCHLFSSNGFEAAAVPHGVDAARLMRHDAPDLILVDQDIPLSGIKTAQIIRLNARYQHIPILLGLKPGAPEHTRETLRLALKYGISWVLARPYKPELLMGKVHKHLKQNGTAAEKTQTPSATRDMEIRKRVRELTDLPTLSPAHQRIISIMSCDDMEVEINELVEAIQSDQGLSMRTLRIARSAGYGFQGNLLPSAITFLGIQKVRQIVQGAIILEIFEDQEDRQAGDLSPRAFWKHSIACGMVMQKISRDNAKSKHFMAGLLHDVGKMVLDVKFRSYARAIGEIVQREQLSRYQVEQELLGITHAEIGLEVASLWQLPREICESIAHHHTPSVAPRHRLLTSLVYLADIAVHKMAIGHSGNAVTPEINDSFAERVRLPISLDEVIAQRDEIEQEVDAIVST